jgi:YEATS domain-containing protein 4
MGPWKHDTDFEEKKEKTLQNIISAKVEIKKEINTVKEKLKLYKEATAKFKTEISKVQLLPTSVSTPA